MTQILAFKLISGEEILGEFNATESTTSVIVLTNPVALVLMQTREGHRGTFMPYVQANTEVGQLSFPIAHMACLPFNVSTEVADAYIKAHSKIDLSAAKPGLTLVKA